MRFPLVLAFSCLAGATAAAGIPTVLFPMRPDGAIAGQAVYAPVAERLSELESLSEVRMTQVPLGPALDVDLELRRVNVVTPGASLYVDGVSQPGSPGDISTMWSGHVVGWPDSYAFLSLSEYGCRGMFRFEGRSIDLVAAAGQNGWSDPRSTFVEADPNAPAVTPDSFCMTDALNPPGGKTPAPVGSPPDIQFGSVPVPIYECRIAFETDYQFFQVFGNLGAAQAYAMSLIGAVADRYHEQNGAIITVPYLAFYTSNNDPWTEQDGNGDCIDVLFQFQNKWDNGAAPVSADLYHMLSGADLGCGVAYLDVLCNQDFGFSVSGNINGGLQFPVSAGPNTWDFLVLAHELGHNFGSPHTHDYCPPLDECAPSGYFGDCQNQQVCTNQGTIMSYCHLCPGGYTNNTLFFHPTVVNEIRNDMANSCLQPFAGLASEVDLGYELAGSNGAPRLDVTFQNPGFTLGFDIDSAPSSQAGILFFSQNLLLAPLLSGTFVPFPDLSITLVANGAGDVSIQAQLQGQISLPAGATFYTQAWFNDPGGPNVYAATNGIEFELIIP